MINPKHILPSALSFLCLLYVIGVNGQDESVAFPIGSMSIQTPEKGTYETDTLGSVQSRSETGTYGGWLEETYEASGFFYALEVDSAWCLVDPEGHPFITVGVTSVDQGGTHELPSALKDWGINAMGNWSDESIPNIPFCPRYNFLNGFKNSNNYRKGLFDEDIFPVFDEGFAAWTNAAAEAFVEPYLENPWVLGYHTDNELRFHYVDINKFLALDSTDANYKAAAKWMMERQDSLAPVSDVDVEDFRAHVAETYMSTVNAALKKYDPNHMNLGCRIHAAVKWDEKLVAAIGKHVDVNSINFYGRWQPYPGEMDMWIEKGSAPFLITEFYTKGRDTELENEGGAGWEVYTQQDRAHHFENMALSLLAHRGSVGWTWFRYTDKEGSNKGILNDDYEEYEILVASMQNMAKDIYGLRDFLLYGESEDDSITGYKIDTPDAAQNHPLIYPVPARDILYLELPSSGSFSNYRIYGVKGNLLRAGTMDVFTTSLDVSSFLPGIYYIQFLNETGQHFARFTKL